MKKMFLFILIGLMPFISKSQVNTELGIGYDTYGRAIANLNVGYSISVFEFQGEMRPSLSRSVYGNHYFGFSGGIRLLNAKDADISVSIGGGYYYNLRSTDHKQLNGDFFGAYLKGIKMINDRGGVFFNTLYINSSAQFSGGIHYVFD